MPLLQYPVAARFAVKGMARGMGTGLERGGKKIQVLRAGSEGDKK